MRLAVSLLALIGTVHFGYDWIAALYPQPDAAARAWFYMMRGVEGLALFAIVATLARSRAVFYVCLLGMFEEGATTACRAAKPIGGILGYEPLAGLCGRDVYGFGLVMLGVVSLGLAYEIGRVRRGKERA